jgi:hypothetical protein
MVVMKFYRHMKIGRNETCPCGSEKKYKKCCLLDNDSAKKMKRPVIKREDFIGSPYIVCPKCNQNTLGIVISVNSSNSYTRECKYCWHQIYTKLPPIKKKILYLDQFFISNIAKALDPKSKGHDDILKQPFWLEAYKKIDRLISLNLIICPDSFFHNDESLLSGDPNFKTLRKVYERLSHGCTFYDYNTIIRFQIDEHAKNYFAGNPKYQFKFYAEKMMHGDPHRWLGRLRVSVHNEPYTGQIDSIRKERVAQYQGVTEVFKRWQTEKGKKFVEWVKEEGDAFGPVTLRTHLKHLQKQKTLADKYAKSYLEGVQPKIDFNDIFPPSSSDIIQQILSVIKIFGINDESEQLRLLIEYLHSKYLRDVPAIHISSVLFAGIARKASVGQKEPPNIGTITDINAISSLLPYCDAMFIDNPMAHLLYENPARQELTRYPTKIFCLNKADNFFQYLSEIEQQIDTEHKKIIEDMYSKDWAQPHLTFLEEKG